MLACLVLLVVGCGDDDVAVDASADAPVADAVFTPDASEDAVVDVAPDLTPDAEIQADTWSNFGQTFMATYCVECHSGVGGGRDYQTIAHVMRDQGRIRCGVAATTLDGCTENDPIATQFPVGNGAKPNDEMRTRFIEWIDAGLAE